MTNFKWSVITVSLLSLFCATSSFSESVGYTYDDLNRLIRAEFGDGTAIAYSYDEIGNRTQKYIQSGACSNLPVKMASGFYPTLKSSYSVVADGNAMQAMSIGFNENLNLNRNVSITLDGGYGCDYTTNPNYSIINGKLTITNGTVTVKNIKVRSVE